MSDYRFDVRNTEDGLLLRSWKLHVDREKIAPRGQELLEYAQKTYGEKTAVGVYAEGTGYPVKVLPEEEGDKNLWNRSHDPDYDDDARRHGRL